MLPKRNKRDVVSGSRVTLPVNYACKPRLSFSPLARLTLAAGLPYLLVNRDFVWYLNYSLVAKIFYKSLVDGARAD